MAIARAEATGSPLAQDGLLLVAGGSNSDGIHATAELYGFATVKTDKDDYPPGETVTITGGGWQPGETVTLLLHEAVDPPFHEDRILSAVADANGNIVNAEFQPEEHDIGVRFYLTATGGTSRREAQTTFTDAPPKANLDQCGNGPLASPSGCSDASDWQNGNLNANQAHYFEGESVPYRLILENFAIGSHTVTIEWDTTENGKHAIDYLTTYNRTETTANPCAGFTCSGPTTAFPIPVDPTVTGASVTQIAGDFTLFGGTTNSVSTYTRMRGAARHRSRSILPPAQRTSSLLGAGTFPRELTGAPTTRR